MRITGHLRAGAIWVSVLALFALPLAVAAQSPLLAWRDPVYIAAGFAGVVGLALLLLQPLLAAGALPGLAPRRSRQIHRITGGALVLAVVAHVAGLWITSPPDVIDALLFASPTPFAAWGVIAMWALGAAGVLALLRPSLPIRFWRIGHSAAAALVVVCTVLHALLIQGTMGPWSKALLCAAVLAATAGVLARRWSWWRRGRRARRLAAAQ